MAEPKTKPTNVAPRDFIAKLDNEKQKAQSLILLDLFEKETGHKAIMWGESIIGFGQYEIIKKGQKPAIWPLMAFSPRKKDLVIYHMTGLTDQTHLIDGLGKYDLKNSCLHLKSLEDIDFNKLKAIIGWGYEKMRTVNGC